jgi:hypothetical protein
MALEGDQYTSGIGSVSAQLSRSKQQLQDAKLAFVRELNRRDPNWTQKLDERRKNNTQNDLQQQKLEAERVKIERLRKQNDAVTSKDQAEEARKWKSRKENEQQLLREADMEIRAAELERTKHEAGALKIEKENAHLKQE